MLFKVTTVVFMTLSVVFASLYLVERSAVINQNPLDAQTKAQAATIEEVNKEELKKSNQTKEKKAVSESLKTVVLTKEVSSHPELTKEEIDLMLEIKNSMSRDYSRRLEREHPLLFERLQLDEAQKEELKLLIGERRLGLNLKPAEGASEEEKAAYQLKKDEILLIQSGCIRVCSRKNHHNISVGNMAPSLDSVWILTNRCSRSEGSMADLAWWSQHAVVTGEILLGLC